MLGYTLDDLDRMTACINIAHDIIDGPAEVEAGLVMAADFLQGLWAEGYFE